jgi:hypothetical protein
MSWIHFLLKRLLEALHLEWRWSVAVYAWSRVGAEVQLHLLLISALDGGERSA